MLSWGVGNRVTIKGQFSETSAGIEAFSFADSTAWSKLDLQAAYLVQQSTAQNDHIVGFGSNDLILGGLGDDVIEGAGGDDVLSGGDGYDLIYGGSGDDIIRGGALDDQLFGGSGADTFVFAPGDGSDVINDFEVGVDKISLLGFSGIDEFDDVFSLAVEWEGDTFLFLGDVTVRLDNVAKSSLSSSDFTFI